jgi:predicted aminopeptidase
MLLYLVALSPIPPFSTLLCRLLSQRCILLVSLGLCLGLLNGCAVGFLWHVSVGQLKLLSRRQPVEEVLRQAVLSEEEQDKLRLIMQVRLFAMEQLGLHADDSYTTFVDVGGPYVTYNVSAAPKDALHPYLWWFPIVGRVPYKGYFNQEAALRQAHKLEVRGYDTYVRGVRAYSTLGYFEDPILSSMLAYPDFALIDTIIHELVHRTVWVRGSVSFNESLASFASRSGVARREVKLRHRFDPADYRTRRETRRSSLRTRNARGFRNARHCGPCARDGFLDRRRYPAR